MHARKSVPDASSTRPGCWVIRSCRSARSWKKAFELCLELGRPETARQQVAEEAADLVYHLLVGLVGVGVPLSDVYAVLGSRRS